MQGSGANGAECRTGQLSVGGHLVDPRANTITGPDGPRSVEPKIMDVLLELCDRKGEVVSREELIDAVWGVQHGGDESLTRAVSLLRKALERSPQGRRAIETFSKRGYRLNLEVTPADETAAANETPAPGRNRGWRDRLARAPVANWGMGLSFLTVAALVVSTLMYRGEEAGAGAVDAAGATPTGQFRIESWSSRPGMADVAELGSRALASAFAQRGLNAVVGNGRADDEAVRRTEFRVAGETRKRGETLVIDVRVFREADGSVLWAHETTRQNADGASSVEGAAAHVANVAECAVSARSQYASAMPAQGMAIWMRYCGASWDDDHVRALEASERLVALSPDEAVAHAAVAKAAGALSGAVGAESSAEWVARAEVAAGRALEIDPGNLDALGIMAIQEPLGEWERTQTAFRAMANGDRSALASNENLFYFMQRSVGYLDDALTQAGFMTARSPGPTHLAEEAWLIATAGMTSRAVGQLDRTIRLYPDHYNAYWRRFNILALHGDLAQAEVALGLAREGVAPGKKEKLSQCWERYLLARLGRIAKEGALTDETCLGEMHDFRARLHGALGQVDEALTYSALAIEEGRQDNSRGMTIHLFYPEMAEVRRDPRFWTLVDGVGLVDFWRDYGRWPDFCSDRREVVDCPAMADVALAARAG